MDVIVESVRSRTIEAETPRRRDAERAGATGSPIVRVRPIGIVVVCYHGSEVWLGIPG